MPADLHKPSGKTRHTGVASDGVLLLGTNRPALIAAEHGMVSRVHRPPDPCQRHLPLDPRARIAAVHMMVFPAYRLPQCQSHLPLSPLALIAAVYVMVSLAYRPSQVPQHSHGLIHWHPPHNQH